MNTVPSMTTVCLLLKVGLEKKTKQNIRLLADFEIVYFFQSDHCVYHAISYPKCRVITNEYAISQFKYTHSLGTVEAWWASHPFPMLVAIIAGAVHLRVFSVIYRWRTADYASRKLDITSECCLGSFQLHHFCVHLDDLELDFFFKELNELMVCQSISLSLTAHV